MRPGHIEESNRTSDPLTDARPLIRIDRTSRRPGSCSRPAPKLEPMPIRPILVQTGYLTSAAATEVATAYTDNGHFPHVFPQPGLHGESRGTFPVSLKRQTYRSVKSLRANVVSAILRAHAAFDQRHLYAALAPGRERDAMRGER